MGFQSAPVLEVLSHADTIEVSYHFYIRVLYSCQLWNSLKVKAISTSYQSYSTKAYIQNN